MYMQPFYKTLCCTPSEYFCTEWKLPEIQDQNILCVSFKYTKEGVSSKNAVKLINNTEQNLVKCETKI